MANKIAGILGGVFCLLGAAGFFALWWFVLSPASETATSMNAMWWLFLADSFGIIDLGLTFWITPIVPGVTVFDFLCIATYITTMPVTSVNFWGVVQLDLFICVLVLVVLIALGGILGIVGAGED